MKEIKLYKKLYKNKVFTHKMAKEQTGLSRSTIYRWFEGQTIPRPTKLAKLVRFLNKMKGE